MRELFMRFMANPSRETFLAVRDALIASDEYDPYSRDLPLATELLNADKYREALDTLGNVFGNLMLSPSAHMAWCQALGQLGQQQDADIQGALCVLCVRGILTTGKGTVDEPYLVTRLTDQYDVLAMLKKKSTSVGRCTEDGRHLDIHSLDDGGQLVFDMTDPNRRLEELWPNYPRPESGDPNDGGAV